MREIPDPKVTEKIYDDEIAPQLAAISKRCQELNIAFCATVEYDCMNQGIGRTEYCPQTSPTRHVSAAQLLNHWAARSNGNVDKLIAAIDRWSREHGHSSIYLQQLGNANIKYGPNEMAAITITQPK